MIKAFTKMRNDATSVICTGGHKAGRQELLDWCFARTIFWRFYVRFLVIVYVMTISEVWDASVDVTAALPPKPR